MPSLVCSIGSWVAFIVTLFGVVWRWVPMDGQTVFGLVIFFVLALLSGMLYTLHGGEFKNRPEKS